MYINNNKLFNLSRLWVVFTKFVLPPSARLHGRHPQMPHLTVILAARLVLSDNSSGSLGRLPLILSFLANGTFLAFVVEFRLPKNVQNNTFTP